MKRKQLFFALILGLCLALFCACAALAEDPLKVSMGLETNQFSEPKEITISISVSNVGESDMPGPVTLYYPSGKQVEEFGNPTLSVGTTKSWKGKWKVTQAELEAGRITFKIKYTIYNEDGELVNKTKNFSKRITYTGGDPQLEVTRDIKPATAQKDQEVTVTYEIANVGGVDVSSVSVKEHNSIASKAMTVGAIPAGGKETVTFTTKMGRRDLTSAATVTYKAGKKTYTKKVEAATIKYGEVKLSATVEADKKGGAPGETVKLTVKLKNTGNVDFTDVKLTDDGLGEAFSDLTVKAGETVTLEKDVTITENQEVQFTVTAQNGTGEQVETATGRVNIIATDPTQQILLSLEASADREVVYAIPGNVRFTITVNNESAVDVANISIRAVDTVINTFDSIPAGESRTFTREMAISMPGMFQFTASCKDQLSQTLTFPSNTVYVGHEQPTAEPTEAPIVTPPAPRYEEVPQSYDELAPSEKLPEWTEQVETVAGKAKWILAGIAGVLLALLLVGFVRRGVLKAQSNKAMDHLDGANYRDYSTQPKRNRRSEISSGSDHPVTAQEEKAEEAVENTAQDSELMAETLKRLYNTDTTDAPSAETGTAEAETAAAAGETQAEETTHRRRSARD